MRDAELVRQVRDGQHSAYEVLVRRWSARLVAYIRTKVRRIEVAEDIAQDSFLKAYRSLHTLSNADKFGAWLLSIAHRGTLDWLKAKARGEVSLEDVSTVANGSGWRSAEEQPDAACLKEEQRCSILAQLDQLPEPLRETIVLYYYQDFTYQQLGEFLGVSSATINARLTKARNLLRELVIDSRSLQ